MSAGSQRSLEPCRFVVIGARRTGTNILREILNTNCEIAMLGEVFTPSSAPAHWPNFIAHRPFGELPPLNSIEASSLLDEYFEFVEYRIRNHWHNNSKALSRAFGVDIKYDQLSEVKPRDRPPTASPFLLDYLKRRGFIIVHSVRKNVIKCAISEMVAQERNLWHNYNRAIIDRTYYIDLMIVSAELGRLCNSMPDSSD